MRKILVLKDKIALITGGARGIGRASALKLANAGANVAIVYYNSSDEALELVQEIEGLGQKACAIQANVADPDSIKEMFDIFTNHFTHLDILVSNAASGVLKPLNKMSTKHWRWCMETNALALNYLVNQFRGILQPKSRIIALSSLGATRAIPNYGFIGASKAALEALVRSLSVELAGDEICINTISAGVIDTDALKYFPNREELLDEYHSKALSRVQLNPQHVADSIYLLCLPEAFMIRGQTIFVDAGYSIVG